MASVLSFQGLMDPIGSMMTPSLICIACRSVSSAQVEIVWIKHRVHGDTESQRVKGLRTYSSCARCFLTGESMPWQFVNHGGWLHGEWLQVFPLRPVFPVVKSCSFRLVGRHQETSCRLGKSVQSNHSSVTSVSISPTQTQACS